MPHTLSESGKRFAFALTVFLLALALRSFQIDAKSLWSDETFTAQEASQPWDAIPNLDVLHPQLFAYLLKAIANGNPLAASEATLRAASAVASALGVAFGVWFVCREGRRGGLLAAGLGAFSPTSVWYGQEARSPALAGCLLLIAVYPLFAIPRMTKSARAAWWAAYVFAAVLALYTHYDTFPVLAAASLVFLFGARSNIVLMREWLLATTLIVILYAPQTPRLMSALLSVNNFPHITRYAPAAGALALFGVILLLFLQRRIVRLLSSGTAPVLISVSAVLALNLGELDPIGSTVKRHVAVVLPILIPVAAVVLSGAISRVWQTALVLSCLPALFLGYFTFQKEDWRGAIRHISAHEQSGDAIFVYRNYLTSATAYYYKGANTVTGLEDGAQAAAAARVGPRRIWLLEAHLADVGPLDGYFSACGEVLFVQQFYRVKLTEIQTDRCG